MPEYDFAPIIDNIFDNGFSRITVSYIRELLFEVYYGKPTGENKAKTDFAIAQELGLTPTQVRNLRYRYMQNHPAKNLTIENILLNNPACSIDGGKAMNVLIQNLYDIEWLKNEIQTKREIYAELSVSREVLKMPSSFYLRQLQAAAISNPELEKAINDKIESLVKSDSELKKALKDTDGRDYFSKISGSEVFDKLIDTGAKVSVIMDSIASALPFPISI